MTFRFNFVAKTITNGHTTVTRKNISPYSCGESQRKTQKQYCEECGERLSVFQYWIRKQRDESNLTPEGFFVMISPEIAGQLEPVLVLLIGRSDINPSLKRFFSIFEPYEQKKPLMN